MMTNEWHWRYFNLEVIHIKYSVTVLTRLTAAWRWPGMAETCCKEEEKNEIIIKLHLRQKYICAQVKINAIGCWNTTLTNRFITSTKWKSVYTQNVQFILIGRQTRYDKCPLELVVKALKHIKIYVATNLEVLFQIIVVSQHFKSLGKWQIFKESYFVSFYAALIIS
jgi:hypothetical protein